LSLGKQPNQNNITSAVSLKYFLFQIKFFIRYLNALSDKEYASTWQPQIFYMNKEPDDPIQETIISPGKPSALSKTFFF
jgi:hypothetical protein